MQAICIWWKPNRKGVMQVLCIPAHIDIKKIAHGTYIGGEKIPPPKCTPSPTVSGAHQHQDYVCALQGNDESADLFVPEASARVTLDSQLEEKLCNTTTCIGKQR